MRISTVGLMALGMIFGVQGGSPDEGRGGSSNPVPYNADWGFDQKPALSQPATIRYSYLKSSAPVDTTWLTLCQTNAASLPLNSTNTWSVALVPPCSNGSWHCDMVTAADPASSLQSQSFTFNPSEYTVQEKGLQNLQNFFFCFGIIPGNPLSVANNTPPAGLICESFSPFFDIVSGQVSASTTGQNIPATPTPTPALARRAEPAGSALIPGLAANPPSGLSPSVSSLTLTTFTVSSVLNGPPVTSSQATPTDGVNTASQTTVSKPPTGTTTIISQPSETSPPKGSSKGGLSLGAKIGIGLGALGFVLIILLFALFCLRRRHAKRSISRSEQVMLTQSVHNESRDLVTEKEIATGAVLHDNDHDNDTDSGPPVLPLPTTRHSALSPYETLPSQPYSGSAAAIPRRKPGSAPTSAGSDTLTRAISTNSERTIEIPAATRASNEHHFEEYHDVPMYSTARAFQGSFLESEDGHSASAANTASEEEARRLEEARLEEEEERRIDAAIAEAERARGTLR